MYMAALPPIMAALQKSKEEDVHVNLENQGCCGNIACCSPGATQTNRNRRVVYYNSNKTIVPESEESILGSLFRSCCAAFSCCASSRKNRSQEEENQETRTYFLKHLKSTTCPAAAFSAIKSFCDENDISWRKWCSLDIALRENEVKLIESNAISLNQEIIKSEFYKSLISLGIDPSSAFAIILEFLSKSPRTTPASSYSHTPRDSSQEEISEEGEPSPFPMALPPSHLQSEERIKMTTIQPKRLQERERLTFKEMLDESKSSSNKRQRSKQKIPHERKTSSSKEHDMLRSTLKRVRPRKSLESAPVTRREARDREQRSPQSIINDGGEVVIELPLASKKEPQPAESNVQIILPKQLEALWPDIGQEGSDEFCVLLLDAIKQKKAQAKVAKRWHEAKDKVVAQLKDPPPKEKKIYEV